MQYKYLMNGQSLILDAGKCFGCEMCINVCPHNVFEMISGKAVIKNRDYCMECDACKINCPVGAIEVNVGMGCAAAIINGILHKTAPDCGCTTSDVTSSERKKACCN
jgi:NAD-dependent dihydropyrimidine dehydrogenase PreA subunit